jgi:arylsulfatase A-like enzyme
VERRGTVIAGVDAPASAAPALLDLQPDPASLRDMAARLRDDAELMPEKAAKARLIASAEEAEARAQRVEAAALWTAPNRCW